MNENDITKAFVFFGILFIFTGLAGVITHNRITDLENKVEELEKQSEEVHEYILNRIGGNYGIMDKKSRQNEIS